MFFLFKYTIFLFTNKYILHGAMSTLFFFSKFHINFHLEYLRFPYRLFTILQREKTKSEYNNDNEMIVYYKNHNKYVICKEFGNHN